MTTEYLETEHSDIQKQGMLCISTGDMLSSHNPELNNRHNTKWVLDTTNENCTISSPEGIFREWQYSPTTSIIIEQKPYFFVQGQHIEFNNLYELLANANGWCTNY